MGKISTQNRREHGIIRLRHRIKKLLNGDLNGAFRRGGKVSSSLFSVNVVILALLSAVWSSTVNETSSELTISDNLDTKSYLMFAGKPNCTHESTSLDIGDPSCPNYPANDGLIKWDMSIGETEYLYMKVDGIPCCGEVLVNPKSGNECYYNLTVSGPRGITSTDVLGIGTLPNCSDFSGLENCENGSTAIVYCDNGSIGHRITFLGYATESGDSYWYYKVESDVGDCQDVMGISHFTLGLIDDEPCCDISCDARVVPTLCGFEIGEIHASADGGSGNYEFSLNGTDWQSSGDFTNLPAGSYTVYVRDADAPSCQTSCGPFVIIERPILICEIEETKEISCDGGGSDGKITVNASLGSGVYLYSLNGGPTQTSNMFDGLSAGEYTVTVYDEKAVNQEACKTTCEITLYPPEECCDFEARCPQDRDLGEYECGSYPPHFDLEAFVAQGGYIGDNACGIVRIICRDDIDPDQAFCEKTMITRTCVVFDDLNDNGILDDGEKYIECEFYYYVLPPELPVTECPDYPETISCDEWQNFEVKNAICWNGLEGVCKIYGEVEGEIIEEPEDACGGWLIIRYKGKDKCDRSIPEVRCSILVEPPPLPITYCPDLPEYLSCDEWQEFEIPDAICTNRDFVSEEGCVFEGYVEGKIIEEPEDACGGWLVIRYRGKDKCDRRIEEVRCSIWVEPPPLPRTYCPELPEYLACDEWQDFEIPDAICTNRDYVTEEECLFEGFVEGEIIEEPEDACGGWLVILYKGKDKCDRRIEEVRCSIEVKPGPLPKVYCPDLPVDPLTCEEAWSFQPPRAHYSNGQYTSEEDCLIEGYVDGRIYSTPDDACGGYLVIAYGGKDICGRDLEEVRCSIEVLPAPKPKIYCRDGEPLTCDEAWAFQPPQAHYSNEDYISNEKCLIKGYVDGRIESRPDDVCGGYLIVVYSGQDICGRDLDEVRCSIEVAPAPLPKLYCPDDLPAELTCDEALVYQPPQAHYSNTDYVDHLECVIEGYVDGRIYSTPDDACGGYLVIAYSGKDICGRDLEEVRCSIEVLPAPKPKLYCPDDLPAELTCDEAWVYQPPQAHYSNTDYVDHLECVIEGYVDGSIYSTPDDACGGYLVIAYGGKDICGRDLEEVRCSIEVLPAPKPKLYCPDDLPAELTCDEAWVYQPPQAHYSNTDYVDQVECVIEGYVDGSIYSTPDDACGGYLVIAYSGKDICGRDLEEVRCSIEVLPAPKPKLYCPDEPATLTCDEALVFVPNPAMYSNADYVTAQECLIEGEVEGEIVARPKDACGGYIIVLYQGKDDCERDLEEIRCSIPVEPADPPEIICPNIQPLTCYDLQDYTPPKATYDNDPNSTGTICDIEGEVEGEIVSAIPKCGGEIVIRYVLKAEDPHNCTDVDIVKECRVTVLPPPPPTIDCEMLTGAKIKCYEDLIDWIEIDAEILKGTVKTTCGLGFELKYKVPEFVDNCNGTAYDVYYYAIDDCKNESEKCKVTYTIEHDLPQVKCAKKEVVQACDGDASIQAAWAAWVVEFSGSASYCGGGVKYYLNGIEVTVLPTTYPGDLCRDFFEVKVVAFNDCETEEVSCTSTFEVKEENTPPMLHGVPRDVILPCGSDLPPWPVVTATDLCDPNVVVTRSERKIPGSCGRDSYRRTWTATDKCGNKRTKSQIILIGEDKDPVLTVPADLVVYCPDEIPEASYEVEETCVRVDVDLEETRSDLNECEYVLTRTWTAVSCRGRTVKSQTIEVRDTSRPEIKLVNPMLAGLKHGDEMVMYGCDAPQVVMSDIEIEGECCGPKAVELKDELIGSSLCDVFGYYRRWRCSYTVTDYAGNVSVLAFYVLQYDTTAPVIEVPEDLHLECGEEFPEAEEVIAEDDCALPQAATLLSETHFVDPEDTTKQALVRTWYAEDHCGNRSEATQILTVCGFDTDLLTSALGNSVWLDANVDGMQGEDEDGINGVKVTLYRLDPNTAQPIAFDSAVTRTINGIAGQFNFDYLMPDAYQVKFEAPTGMIPTLINEGEDEELDSDANVGSMMTDVIYLEIGQQLMSVDAGFIPEPQSDAQISSFEVKNLGCENAIIWTTTSENLIDHYVIERSSGGTHYENIGEMKAIGGPDLLVQYDFEDPAPKQMNLYRLKIVDHAGLYRYSDIRSVVSSCRQVGRSLNVFPNPTSGTARLSFTTTKQEHVRISVMDQLGRELYTIDNTYGKGFHNETIDLSQQPEGVYYLKINQGGTLSSHAIIKAE